MRVISVGFSLATYLLASSALGSTGITFQRTLATTSVGECRTGQLLERLSENIDYYSASTSVTVACLRSPNRAAWVFITGSTIFSGVPWGSSAPYWGTLPSHLPQFNRDSGQELRSTYNALRFGMGKNCWALQQVWHCRSLEFIDRTFPRFSPAEITAIGRRPLEVIFRDDALALGAEEFPVDQKLYTYVLEVSATTPERE